MNSRLEDQLRSAFEEASDSIEPRAELASRIRASARRQRRLALAIVAACAIMLATAALTYVAGGLHQNAPAAHRHRGSNADAPRTLLKVRRADRATRGQRQVYLRAVVLGGHVARLRPD
jgi:hypothetical protein